MYVEKFILLLKIISKVYATQYFLKHAKLFENVGTICAQEVPKAVELL